MSSPETSTATTSSGDVRELRLAVVLYGGASLAIYMHGTTKELHRLIRASTALETGGAGGDATPTERFWGDLLGELARRDPQQVRTRVVVDVVAGTSAGGINGVFLSKAVAHNRSLDALRDLWFTKGDIVVLLRGPSWMPAPLKIPFLLAGAVKKPVLKGDAIAQWMYEALRDMDAPGAVTPETLLPDRHPLELFVTVTDFEGYRRDVVIADPPLVRERAHRHVLTFRRGGSRDDFDKGHNGALAFAARTTMSFPGAFPPVSLKSFQAAVADDADDISESLPALFRIYKLSGTDADRAVFIDGGVLDNKPFGYAIQAIRRRPAESEVDRKLIFLEPDPGLGGGPASGKTPSPLATILASVSGLPRQEPILDDIVDVTAHNERVARIRDIVKVSFDPISELVRGAVGSDLGTLAMEQTPDELARWMKTINEEARKAAGFGYATYVRSKVAGVVDSFARTVCRLSDFPEDCNQAAFVRAVLRAWARTRLLEGGDGSTPLEDQQEFLRTFDLEYGARRLRFVIDGLSAWYAQAGKPGYPSRAELDSGKAALWQARAALLDALDGRGLKVNLTDEVLEVFAEKPIDEAIEAGEGAPAYVQARADELALLEVEFGKAIKQKLEGFDAELYAKVNEITKGWDPQRRADILVRYLGFPFWDILLYPIQSIADAGERDAIEVVRMSPRDTGLLPPIDPTEPKLSGFTKMHFGAFFDRAGREGDYLWGRLDAAERLIFLLGKRLTDDEKKEWCKRAFAAIVEEEDNALPNAKPLLDHARAFAKAGA